VCSTVRSRLRQALGKVTSPGAFRIDQGRANASGTVFEGSTVETDAVPATVLLDSGIVVRLAAQTAITARSGSVVVSKGEPIFRGMQVCDFPL